MFKWVILLFTGVWVLGFFCGKKRRIIQGVDHLLLLILWAVLVFMGYTYVPRLEIVQGSMVVQAVVLVVWAALAWVLAGVFLRVAHIGRYSLPQWKWLSRFRR